MYVCKRWSKIMTILKCILKPESRKTDCSGVVLKNDSNINYIFIVNSCVSFADQGGNNLRGMRSSGMSDLSNDSESPTHGYPDFPPSPDSWLGESVSRSNQVVNNQTSDC